MARAPIKQPCPGSRRGHSWGGRVTIGRTKERICRKCGAPGYLNNQGVTVPAKQPPGETP